MGRANFMFAGFCALALAVATALVASAEDLPVRDPDGVVVPTYVRLPIILLIAWLLDVLPRALARSRTDLGAFPAAVREVVSQRWHRTHVVFAVTGLGTWYVCYAAFRNLKSYVPFVRGKDTVYDDRLASIDHKLWFGHDPANVLHSLFGTHWSAEFFSAVYVVWIVLIPVTLAIALMWTRRPAAGSWYVTAVAVDWLLGVATYFAVPTLGPAYSKPGDFAGLHRTYTSQLVDDLMRDRKEVLADPNATHAVQTIAAFPSLHVGMMVTICLFVTLAGLAKWIRVTAWVYLVLTILSTIYMGWHFSVDALGGAVIGVLAVWIAAIGTGNHVGGRPRLIERGTHEDPVDESHKSASATRVA
ncbi:MAG: phosphatase PAP2 family protein [Marmoricola sp.]